MARLRAAAVERERLMFPLYDDNPIRHTPLVTYALVAINVLVFLWINQLPESQQQVLAYRHGFVPARIIQLSQPHPIYVPINVTARIPFFGDRLVPQPLELAPAAAANLVVASDLHVFARQLVAPVGQHVVSVDLRRQRGRPAGFAALFDPLLARRRDRQRQPLGGRFRQHSAGDRRQRCDCRRAGGLCHHLAVGAGATLVFLVIFVTIIDVPALMVFGAWFLAQVVAGHESLYHSGAGGVAWWAHVGGFVAGMVLMPRL